MLKLLLIGVGSLLGGLARYGVSELVYRLFGSSFPLGTLTVNVVGCGLIGFAATLTEQRLLLSPEIRGMWFIGVFGAFTTFSTFGYETLQLLQAGSVLQAAANVLLNVVMCLLAVWLGNVLGRMV